MTVREHAGSAEDSYSYVAHLLRVAAEVVMPATCSTSYVRIRLALTLSVAVTIALLLPGCMVPLHTRGQRSPDPSEELARKLVVGKEAPLDLIAEDGTRCSTTKSRFEKTRIGSKVWCLWSGDVVGRYP